MNMDSGRRSVRTVLTVCLCALYLLLAMGVALLGGSLYRGVAARGDETAAQRTALSYLANQLRRSGAKGVELGTFGGVDALRLTERTGDGARYCTLLYCWEDSLMELYMADDAGLLPEDGIAVLPLRGLTVAWDGSLLTLSVETPGGRSCSLSLSPRCGVREVGAL